MSAAANLRAVARGVADVPATALARVESEAERIVAAAAPTGSMRGHKHAGLPVRMARNQRPQLGATSTFRVQGTVPGWIWANTGTRAHRIPRRHRGNKARLYVKHPGSRGSRSWRRVVAEVTRMVPRIVADEMSRVLR